MPKHGRQDWKYSKGMKENSEWIMRNCFSSRQCSLKSHVDNEIDESLLSRILIHLKFSFLFLLLN